MSVYPILNNAAVVRTAVPNAESLIVTPSSSGLFPNAFQQWEAVLNGVGSCSATVQLLGSNDRVNWVPISTIALTAASADVTPGVGAYGGNNQFKHYSGYVSAISGTNAKTSLNVSA